MKLYEVTFTEGLAPDPSATSLALGVRYFPSMGEARKWCNARIRVAFARWKEHRYISRLSDVAWDESIQVAEVHTAEVPTKALILRMLNPPDVDAPHLSHATVLECWTPQDKWKAINSRVPMTQPNHNP